MTYDILIIGGGINGCAIAREAALNGLSVLLVEKDDLASHTSSASTKLIHGGLRYLESYEFRLVHEALHERERLMRAAPHLIRPMKFVLPHDNAVRPWWMVRAGLFLYDLLGGRSSLPKSRGLRDGDALYRAPLRGEKRGFVYADAWVDDARLTLAMAVDAAQMGAQIATRTALTSATRTLKGWRATLSDGRSVEARALVNAAGPWVPRVATLLDAEPGPGLRLVKGSHIVVDRLYDGEHAYILQQPDRRIVFAVPWLHRYTAIGTTDVPVDTPEQAVIGEDEIAYLIAASNRAFFTQVARSDVRHVWSGVRALVDDGADEARTVTRDYSLVIDDDGAPVLTVYGGKITTARALGEDALRRLAEVLGLPLSDSSRNRPLPGGDATDFESLLSRIRDRYPFLGAMRAERMAHAYGTQLFDMLDRVSNVAGMGTDLGGGLTEIELRWMRDREWARTVDDVLWRRSKLGMAVDDAARERINALLAEPTQA
ncbi:glycerol-3-phosphate dehydrogenase [Sphingomonas sp. AX6]|uniref:glycerol-3-phosphate dehydrogenase n=1 Tax=Sphingomonas sp. AX6 TaxID=2653171 RepID=UPI0012F00B36|nr:glycerol-3-phosphate dehydrogenase [Sphingomonas sp. AX6]VXC41629.1 Glycerol-3-phosphate dehydrogenase [Sphingomonas sp. AX6]